MIRPGFAENPLRVDHIYRRDLLDRSADGGGRCGSQIDGLAADPTPGIGALHWGSPETVDTSVGPVT